MNDWRTAVSLHEIQRDFLAGVLSGDGAAITNRIRRGRFEASRHLQIYRNNVYTSLTGALEAVYPVVLQLIGDDCFRGCAYGYIRQSPPTGGNLHDFGGGFADFLATFDSVCTLEYLPDVARLEWSWHRAFHAADTPPLELDALGRVAPEQYGALRFRLHPSVHLHISDYPLLDIWQTNRADTPNNQTIDLRSGGVKLLVVRRGLTVEIETIDDTEYVLLRTLAEDRPLADVATAVHAVNTDFDLPGALRGRVQDQTVTGFSLESKERQEV